MAKIKEMKGFVQICEDACIALGDAITKLQNLPDKCVDLIITDSSFGFRIQAV